MTPDDPAASDQEVALGADHDSSSDEDFTGDINLDPGGPTNLGAHPHDEVLIGAPQLSGDEGDGASGRS
jgi:hypothetical protein